MIHLLLKTGKEVNTHSETDKMCFGLKLFFTDMFSRQIISWKAEPTFNWKEVWSDQLNVLRLNMKKDLIKNGYEIESIKLQQCEEG